VILGFVPSPAFVIVALILFCIVPPLAGRIRRHANPESLVANHMTYLIRTVWIFTLLALVTVIAATIYVLSVYDPGPLQSCIATITAATQAGQNPDPQMLEPCIGNFALANKTTFAIGGLVAGLPAVLYLVYRLARGISRAQKGYRIDNVKNWL
jgi:uncharacterized membrane protein